ncbi:unnamed protein product [Peronospora farinosa]|uniref:Uncharacterized protein n=1 Tax=Peronospora farinosa TaxID=134698 RepID=A0AAV0U3N2_9STRA|nr:unnamed protein product [Peronospora farinosa]CAI5731354.1 unnamed protein product [Peronospora farinosa]
MNISNDDAAAREKKVTHACLYCTNVKALRDLLPPKRCDYCHKFRCQFCTLKFPLLGVRKGLPKKLKGNSHICIQCFGKVWQENEAAVSSDILRCGCKDSHCMKHAFLPNTQGKDRESRGASFIGIEPVRRRSTLESELMMSLNRRSFEMDSSHRTSMLESERRMSMMAGDQVWPRCDSIDDSRRLSLGNDLVEQPKISKDQHSGIAYRMASCLGLIASDIPDGTSMNFAIDMWMSLFAASILLVIALADGFTLHQRLWYCIATYGIFITLHPWIHADRLSGYRPRVTEETAQSNVVALQAAAKVKATRQKSSAVPGNGPVSQEYKARLQAIKKHCRTT